MNTLLIVKETYPTRAFSIITQIGLKALNLATSYITAIDERLPGAADSLKDDLDSLGVAVPVARQKRHESVAATTAQKARIRQGHARVRAVRQTIRKAGAPGEIQRAYGVGQRVDSTQIRDVTAALQQIVDRAGAAPEEAADYGINPAAVAELKTFLASLMETDKAQEKQRADAPLTTKERNRIANRVLQTVALIAGAGMLAFADNPPTYASFEALLARSKKAGKAKKGAPPEAPNASEAPKASESSEAPESPKTPELPKVPDSRVTEASGGIAEAPVA
jgi:hypothetical protein